MRGAVCVCLGLLTGCGLFDDLRSKVEEVALKKSAPAAAEAEEPVTVDGNALVERWHQAINAYDITAYGAVLGDPMIYYTKTMTAVEASGRKSRSLNKVSGFRQETVGSVDQQLVGTNEVWLRFRKRVSWEGQQKQFNTVLVYGRVGDDWKLIKESDGPTERARTKKNRARLNKAKRVEHLAVDVDGDGQQEMVSVAVLRERRGERRDEKAMVLVQDGADATFLLEYSSWGDSFWKTGMILPDGQELIGWSRAPMNGTCWEHTLQRWGVQGFKQVLASERCGHDTERGAEFMVISGEIHQLDPAGDGYETTGVAVR